MHPLLQILFFPISFIYGLVIFTRNKCFDWGLLKEKKYPVPIINVGNLSMGGTGKTPQIEYLIHLLSKKYRIATISRGYKRKTKGLIMANATHTYEDIGDEPLQFVKKFLNITVIVSESRRKAIEFLLSKKEPPEVILLDDAFQHRYIKPTINILLTDASLLYVNDFIFPSGKLREFRSGAHRADIIIVTKTESLLSKMVKNIIEEKLNIKSNQKLFYSYINYKEPVPLYNPDLVLPGKCGYIQIISGIANPYPLEQYIKSKCSDYKSSTFPDHHEFNENEIQKIVTDFENHLSIKKVIITTEKDAQRLQKESFKKIFKNIPVFYIPMEIRFHGEAVPFDQLIFEKIENKIQNL